MQGNFEGNVLKNEGKCYTRILMSFFKKVLFLIPFHIDIFIGLPVIIFIEISSKTQNCRNKLVMVAIQNSNINIQEYVLKTEGNHACILKLSGYP